MLLRQLQLLQKFGEGGGLLQGGASLPAPLLEGQQGRGQAAAQQVQLPQPRLGLLGVFVSVAVGVLAPVLFPVPGAAPQLPFIDVVGEPVALSLVKAGEPGAARIRDEV